MPSWASPRLDRRARGRLLAGGLLLAVLSLAGAAGAYHLSAGARDQVGLQPDETPERPSVPDSMHERGTRTDCGDEASPAALGPEAFCGRLAYHANTTLSQTSPPDQQFPSPAIGTFDVVYAGYVGTYGLGTCAPWCFPGGEPVYRALHDAGAQAGVTPPGEEAYARDQGWQTYGGGLAVPNALATLADETGAWEADGWVVATPDQRFVGFLADTEGRPIDDEALAELVAADDGLAADALPRVCGFTPDADVATPGARPGCEVPLRWQGSSGEAACGSPTYVCGAAGEAAWQARVVCSAALPGCSHAPGSPPGSSDVVRDDPSASTADYDVWHWVVAPTPSDCGGHREPGFDVAPDTAERTFLAHDLDVYEPAASPAGLASPQLGSDASGSPDVAPPAPTSGARDPEVPGTTLVAKDHRVEPNAPGDTSQSRVEVTREDDACHRLLASTESAEHVDPWVDVIDARVYRNLWLDSILGVDPWLEGIDRRTYQQPPVTGVFGDANDAYLTGDERQDASNRPGPWLYSAGGQLGVFADKDDDGRYDPAPNSRLFEGIESLGAYPLFWDARVDGDGGIDADAGCRLGDGGSRLASAMAEAGYGPRTGMVMVVYLPQPTVLYEWRTSRAFPEPGGQQAYVLLSQSLHAQRDDPAVQGAIAAALERVPAALSPGDPGVVYPGDRIAPASDFYEQCGYPTGGFHTSWSFAHAAQAGPGATIVSGYVLDNQAPDGQLGAEGPIPAFQPDGEAYGFTEGVSTWFDVDPLDGDPDRNTDTCAAPPHEGDSC